MFPGCNQSLGWANRMPVVIKEKWRVRNHTINYKGFIFSLDTRSTIKDQSHLTIISIHEFKMFI